MNKLIPNTNYQINEEGIITNINTKHALKAQMNPKTGYYYARLYDVSAHRPYNISVHKLMRNAFMLDSKPEGKWEIGHRDENKANNALSNLYWTTHKDNCNYGDRNKKISKTLLEMKHIGRMDIIRPVYCVETDTTYKSICECCKELNLAKSNLSRKLNQSCEVKIKGYTLRCRPVI